jgi:hypothetical protein
LTGLEQRGCWQERQALDEPVPPETGAREAGSTGISFGRVDADPPALPRLDFVPVDLPIASGARHARREPRPGDGARIETGMELEPPLRPSEATLDQRWAERTTLFGDAEP